PPRPTLFPFTTLFRSSSDGKYLVTTCDDSVVTEWNLETYDVENSFPQPTSTKSAVFSPNAAYIATGDRNATVRVWDIFAQIPVRSEEHTSELQSRSDL